MLQAVFLLVSKGFILNTWDTHYQATDHSHLSHVLITFLRNKVLVWMTCLFGLSLYKTLMTTRITLKIHLNMDDTNSIHTLICIHITTPVIVIDWYNKIFKATAPDMLRIWQNNNKRWSGVEIKYWNTFLFSVYLHFPLSLCPPLSISSI